MVADRLCSVFGQDIVDALFWTATEPRGRKREHLGVIPHFILAFVYIVFHTMLILCQATTLSVAMNSRNKALLTIMLSNNFVELKGSVFKKFEKNNLFQLSCADIRERFHLFILLSMVVIQTMREYAWKEDRFWILFPDCITVLLAELIIDWVKHAFITRFNDIPIDVYKDFTTSLAYDLADTKQKFAHTDHSDIVARRMGFTPIPLSVLVIRIILQATRWTEVSDLIVSFFLWLAFFSVKVLSSVLFLGSACELIDDHQKAKGFNKSKQETEILIDEVERDALIGLKLRSKSVCSLPAEATCDVIPRSPKGRSLSQSPVRRRKVTIYDERAVSVDGNGDDLPGDATLSTEAKSKNPFNAINLENPTIVIKQAKSRINVGCLNIRSVKQEATQAFLAHKMEKYNIDILCISVSETRISGSGSIVITAPETLHQFHFCYSGVEDNSGLHVVGFIMSQRIRNALLEWEHQSLVDLLESD
ncbi:hypothetical protein QYM36_011015 [Artemia franciscana]|uniref:Uncharacterized protein n=1 Tax=Artemia franciscana TaxID=6661 RepID=A0AA88HKW8_ARTSF|nr:hypothetical protein QYM36_011015 [Artemia franciscana]